MKKLFAGLMIAIVAILALSGCNKEVADDGKLKVVVTVGMLGDLVRNIGGDLVAVEGLMGSGVDPHLYQPSAGDIGRMENADVVFYVGLHLEGKMTEIFESLALKKKVAAVSAGLDKARLLDPQVGQTGNYDPHIWFDVDLWSGTAGVVVDVLSEMDPENADQYKQNGAAYISELQNLHQWVLVEMAKIPEDQRVLITAHDAFNYFGRAYGVDVRGIQGISTASDYGLKDLEELIDFIVEGKIKAIFVESSVPKKSIEALQQGVQAKGFAVEIGGQLFSDAMGDAGSEEGTYIGMVKYNVNTIVNALK